MNFFLFVTINYNIITKINKLKEFINKNIKIKYIFLFIIFLNNFQINSSNNLIKTKYMKNNFIKF